MIAAIGILSKKKVDSNLNLAVNNDKKIISNELLAHIIVPALGQVQNVAGLNQLTGSPMAVQI
jgi:hypothetical protein